VGRSAYAWLARRGYRLAYALLRVYWFVARPHKRGVRCVIRRERDVLLVRHSYGDRGWMLPGGRLKRGETPAAGARREIRQELGADLDDWRQLGSIVSRESYKHDTAFHLEAELGEAVLDVDSPEFDEVAWCSPAELPEGASEALLEAERRGFLGGGAAAP